MAIGDAVQQAARKSFDCRRVCLPIISFYPEQNNQNRSCRPIWKTQDPAPSCPSMRSYTFAVCGLGLGVPDIPRSRPYQV